MTTPRSDVRPRFYLSLGDSLAAGVQPTGDADAMYRTDEGYADQLYATMCREIPSLRLVKLGCPGETTQSMIDGGICDFGRGNQLAEAVQFLERHRGSVEFVTIDIGFNDFEADTLEALAGGFGRIQANLPLILQRLRDATGPGVPIVGMTIYDPFLAEWRAGPGGRAIARLSVDAAIGPLNDLLRSVYAAAGSPVADVEGAFATSDFDTMIDDGGGTAPLPTCVARVCEWTWVAAAPPLGPDRHPNRLGYRGMASAFEAALRPALAVGG